jgi:hypothetical protein
MSYYIKMSQLSSKQLESTVGGVVALIAVVTGVAYFRSNSTSNKINSLAVASGPLNGPGAGPLNGPGAGPLNGPGAGPLNGPGAGPLNGPGAGPLNGPGAGPLNGPGAGPLNGPGAGPDAGTPKGPSPDVPLVDVITYVPVPVPEGGDPTLDYYNVNVPNHRNIGETIQVDIYGIVHPMEVTDKPITKAGFPKPPPTSVRPSGSPFLSEAAASAAAFSAANLAASSSLPRTTILDEPHAPIAGKRVNRMIEIIRPADVKDGDVVDINDDTGKFVAKLIIPSGSVPGEQIYFDVPSDPYRVPINAVLPTIVQQRLTSGAEEPIQSLEGLSSTESRTTFGSSIGEENPSRGFPSPSAPPLDPLEGSREQRYGGKTPKPKKSRKTRKQRKILNQVKKLLKEI